MLFMEQKRFDISAMKDAIFASLIAAIKYQQTRLSTRFVL